MAHPTMVVDPTAIQGRRIAAWSIDLAIFLALVAGLLAVTGGVSWTTHQFANARQATAFCRPYEGSTTKVCSHVDDQAVLLNVKGSADWVSVWFVYFIAYCIIGGVTGSSIGKFALGLRVVDADGNLSGFRASFVRTVLWLVDAITCGIPIVGGSLMVSNNGHRRVGDMAAGTFVVPKAFVGSPIVLPPRPGSYEYAYGYPPPGIPPAGPYPGPSWTPPAGASPPPPMPTPPPATGAPQGSDTAAPVHPHAVDPSTLPPPVYPPAYPAPYPAPAPATPANAPATSDADGPHWDEARDTYIQYDRSVGAWVQWDERHHHWRPIEQ